MKLDPDEQVVKNSEFKNTVRQKSSSFNNGFVQLLDISQKKIFRWQFICMQREMR